MTAEHITPPRSDGGNVFLDLGFPPEEAERLALQVDLYVVLVRLLRKRRGQNLRDW